MHVLEDSAILFSLQDEGVKGNISRRRERRAILRYAFHLFIVLSFCSALVRLIMSYNMDEGLHLMRI